MTMRFSARSATFLYAVISTTCIAQIEPLNGQQEHEVVQQQLRRVQLPAPGRRDLRTRNSHHNSRTEVGQHHRLGESSSVGIFFQHHMQTYEESLQQLDPQQFAQHQQLIRKQQSQTNNYYEETVANDSELLADGQHQEQHKDSEPLRRDVSHSTEDNQRQIRDLIDLGFAPPSNSPVAAPSITPAPFPSTSKPIKTLSVMNHGYNDAFTLPSASPAPSSSPSKPIKSPSGVMYYGNNDAVTGPWPECVGWEGQDCKLYIETVTPDHPKVVVIGGPATTIDYHRVRVFTSVEGLVIKVPERG